MKQSTSYCLISPVSEEEPLWRVLNSFVERLREKEIPHQQPKLKWHSTYITPFKALPSEVACFVIGLEIGSFERGSCGDARITGLDFFKSTEMDALILRLEISPGLRQLIERARILIEECMDMKFPPESFQVNMHVTIAEGKDLFQHIERHGGVDKLFKDLQALAAINLAIPVIHRKSDDGKYWVPVRL
jgi:2'-5' RNA ligase